MRGGAGGLRRKTCPPVATGGASTGGQAIGRLAIGRLVEPARQRGGTQKACPPVPVLPPRRSPPAAPGSRGRLKTCPPVEVRFGPRPALPDAPGLGPRQRDRRQRDRLFGGGNRRVTRMRGAAGGAGKEDLSPSSVPRGGWPQQGDRLLGGCRLGEGAGSWGGHLVGVPNAVEFF